MCSGGSWLIKVIGVSHKRTVLPAMVHALKHVDTAAALCHRRCLVPAHLRIGKHDAQEALCCAGLASQNFQEQRNMHQCFCNT